MPACGTTVSSRLASICQQRPRQNFRRPRIVGCHGDLGDRDCGLRNAMPAHTGGAARPGPTRAKTVGSASVPRRGQRPAPVPARRGRWGSASSAPSPSARCQVRSAIGRHLVERPAADGALACINRREITERQGLPVSTGPSCRPGTGSDIEPFRDLHQRAGACRDVCMTSRLRRDTLRDGGGGVGVRRLPKATASPYGRTRLLIPSIPARTAVERVGAGRSGRGMGVLVETGELSCAASSARPDHHLRPRAILVDKPGGAGFPRGV